MKNTKKEEWKAIIESVNNKDPEFSWNLFISLLEDEKQKTLKEFSDRINGVIDNSFRGMPNNAKLLKLEIEKIKQELENETKNKR